MPTTLDRPVQTRQYPSTAPSTPKPTEPESSSDASPQPTPSPKLTNVFVTGGMGFIGSHLVRQLLRQPGVRVINIDCGTYAAAGGRRFPAGDPDAPISEHDVVHTRCSISPRHVLISARVEDWDTMDHTMRWYDPKCIFHLAAESHVDRSIEHPGTFARTNVLGTQVLLEAVRKNCPKAKFVYVSTDEVYGSWSQHPSATGAALEGSAAGFAEYAAGFVEYARLNPSNPYAASKAAAEQFCLAYHKTYGTDVVITRGANTYGTHQYPEKFLPVIIDNAVHDRPVPLYGDGEQARQWLHVEDHVAAIQLVAEKGLPGGIYNVPGRGPLTNKSIAGKTLELLGKPRDLIQFVADRPAHDRCYAIVGDRLRDLGWKRRWADDTGILDTIHWYASPAGQEWIESTAHDTKERLGQCT